MGAVRFPKRLPGPPKNLEMEICGVLERKYFEVRDLRVKRILLRTMKRIGCSETLPKLLRREKNPKLIGSIASLLE